MKILFIMVVAALVWVIVRYLNRSPAQPASGKSLPAPVNSADPDRATSADEPDDVRALIASIDAGPPDPATIESIRTDFSGSGNIALRDALIAQLPKVRNHAAQVNLVDAIRSIDDSDATDAALVAQVAQMKDLHFSRVLKWAVDRLNFADAVAEFAAAGFLEPPDSDALDEIREGLEDDDHYDAALFTWILRRLPQVRSFEAYKPSKSVWYDDLIPFVFGNLEPPVHVEGVEVETNDESQIAAVTWRMDGRQISEPYESDEPLDVAWFIAMANRQLVALGSERRCLSPELHDDRVNLWIAEPGRLLPLLRKYHIAYNESLYRDDSLHY